MRQDPTAAQLKTALRGFVTAHDGLERALPEDCVLMDITHSNLRQKHLEIRFSKHMKCQELYHLIHQKTGSLVDDLELHLIDHGEATAQIAPYASATRPLGYYLPHTSATASLQLHCIDRNPHSISARGALEDVSLVEKYRMSDEEYAARHGTLREWKVQQQAVDPTFTLQKHAAMHAALQKAKMAYRQEMPLPEGFQVNEDGEVVAVGETRAYDSASVQHCHVGDRCQITPGQRRGKVMWVGEIPGHNYWVGIVLDEPVGANNGTFVKTGKRYFEASDMYGVYCRGRNVETGDFPERDLIDSDEEDEL